MEKTQKSQRGGYRGGRRPATGRDKILSIRVSSKALEKLNSLTRNKSEYIDNLILSI